MKENIFQIFLTEAVKPLMCRLKASDFSHCMSDRAVGLHIQAVICAVALDIWFSFQFFLINLLVRFVQ